MSEVGKSTALGAFATQLRVWRKRNSWTQAQLAQKLHCSDSLIGNIETTAKRPTADFAAACDGVFDAPETFITLHGLLAREAYPAFFAPVVDFEREAARIHAWELGAIPGLLQTEAYAHALIKSGRITDDEAAIDQLVTARIERQVVLNSRTRPIVWYVLDEAVLRRVVGDRTTMRDQLDKLIEVADMPSIVLQVLPFTADNHAGSDGAITVFEFAKAPTVGYTECYSGGRIVEALDEVASLMTVVNLIRASALSPLSSLELIRQIRSDLS
jgi:transcriptional regulator with XRE-family HTH domain